MTSTANHLDWLFLAIGWALGAGGVGLGAWALFWDRAKRGRVLRRRCPKCWYDMAGVPGLRCPECGKPALSERRLAKTRRKWRWASCAAVIALAALATSQVPRYRRGGWARLVPSSVLVWIAPLPADGGRGGTAVSAYAFQTQSPQQVAAVLQQLSAGGSLTAAQQQRIQFQLRAAQPPIPVRTIGEQLTDEVWRRFSARELWSWQAGALLRRRFQAAGVDGPWAIVLPPRWPVDRPIPAQLGAGASMWDLADELMVELFVGDPPRSGHYTRWRPHADSVFRVEGTARLDRDQPLRVRLWLGDRIVHQTRRPLGVTMVPDAASVMVPVDSPEATAIVREVLDVTLVEEDGRLVMKVKDRSDIGARPVPDFAVVIRSEVLVDGELIARSVTWAAREQPEWTNPSVMIMDRAVGGARKLARGRDRAQIRIVGSAELAAVLYLSRPFQWTDFRCWVGEFTVPARWEPPEQGGAEGSPR